MAHKTKAKRSSFAKGRKGKVGRGKPKGKAPQSLRKKRRTLRPRAKKPEPREVGLIDAIGEGLADVIDLAQEMRSWHESLEDKFSTTTKYEEVGAAADELEEIENEDPVGGRDDLAFLNEFKITIQDMTPRARGHSRADRLGHCEYIIHSVMDKLDELEDEEGEAGEAVLTVAQEGIAADLKSELDEIESKMQGISFPGMF